MAKPKAEAEAKALPEVDAFGHLSVELGGTRYTLRPSRQAISNIERAIGRSRGVEGPVALPSLMVQAGAMALSVEECGLCVAELMRAYAEHDPEASADYRGVNADRAADLIFEAGPVDTLRALSVIFVGALTGGYSAAGEAKAAGMTMTRPTPTAE